MENVLEVSNLKKNYGSFQAVKGISFEVKEGEIFALIGPNGAGKSTTLKIVSTLLSPSSGKIKIADLDVIKEADKVREMISYLPEDSGAYKNLKGIEYLKFMAGLYAKSSEQAQIYLEKAKKISGLGTKLNNKTGTYSKGMTRKLLLARSVMMNPKLAILDEPTSGLDIINAMEIRKIVRQLAKEGMAVLLSSHNMLEIELLSDRIAIIDQGKIHESGTPSNLKAKYGAKNIEEVFVKSVNPKESK